MRNGGLQIKILLGASNQKMSLLRPPKVGENMAACKISEPIFKKWKIFPHKKALGDSNPLARFLLVSLHSPKLSYVGNFFIFRKIVLKFCIRPYFPQLWGGRQSDIFRLEAPKKIFISKPPIWTREIGQFWNQLVITNFGILSWNLACTHDFENKHQF